MMLQEHVSHQLLEDQKCQVSWSVWTKKIPMLEKKLKQKEEFLLLNIQLNMVSLPIGMIWKKSGIIVSSMNLELPQKNTLAY